MRALENLVKQNPEPLCSTAVQSVLPRHVNLTDPVGMPTRDLTLADSFTRAPTNAVPGVAVTVVVVACLTCGAAVAALAGSAHNAQVAVTRAVTDTRRARPAPARWPWGVASFPVGALFVAAWGDDRLRLMPIAPLSLGYGAKVAMAGLSDHPFINRTLRVTLRITGSRPDKPILIEL